MSDGRGRGGGVPGWYWLVAMAALLFELAGCYALYLQLTTDAAALPVDQRALIEATPMWITGAYALAVVSGLVGAIALLQRRRFAKGALLLSLVAIAVQFGGILLVPALRSSIPSDELLGPIVIFVLAYGFWQFAKIAAKRDWLR
ncbi:MAG: hypothetical protein ABIR51_03990 [Sphingomicrobium sp.]